MENDPSVDVARFASGHVGIVIAGADTDDGADTGSDTDWDADTDADADRDADAEADAGSDAEPDGGTLEDALGLQATTNAAHAIASRALVMESARRSAHRRAASSLRALARPEPTRATPRRP